MRVLAIDYGDARTGLAFSDLTRTMTGDAYTIPTQSMTKAAMKIAELVKENGVDTLVLGYPLNMDGTEGPRAEKSRVMAEKLKEFTGLEVTLWDERWTTVSAHEILTQVGKHGKKRKEKVDAVAASLILEGYLSRS